MLSELSKVAKESGKTEKSSSQLGRRKLQSNLPVSILVRACFWQMIEPNMDRHKLALKKTERKKVFFWLLYFYLFFGGQGIVKLGKKS